MTEQKCIDSIIVYTEFQMSKVYYCAHCGDIVYRSRQPEDPNNMILNTLYYENRKAHYELLKRSFGDDFGEIELIWKLNDKIYEELLKSAETDMKLKNELFKTDSEYFIEKFWDVLKRLVEYEGLRIND